MSTSITATSSNPETRALAEKWDQRYRQASPGEAVQVLRENRHLLPASGDALDLACGLGANALLLAQAGLRTRAWDVSGVAIERLNAQAATNGLSLIAEQRDVLAVPPDANSLDVIVVSRFLERHLCPALTTALRPNGLLFYQTFTRDKASSGGPSNPDFLLAENELLRLFAELRLRVYREEGSIGDNGHRLLRNEALLVAQKRA